MEQFSFNSTNAFITHLWHPTSLAFKVILDEQYHLVV